MAFIAGTQFCLPSYVSGTGTAGVDNTAQVVKSITIPANTLKAVGDRIRLRSYWTGTTGSAITGTASLNSVTIGATSGGTATAFEVTEAWLHYIDATHANIIETGNPPGAASGVNVAGFNWAADQTFALSQNQITNNHIIVYALFADVLPRSA